MDSVAAILGRLGVWPVGTACRSAEIVGRVGESGHGRGRLGMSMAASTTDAVSSLEIGISLSSRLILGGILVAGRVRGIEMLMISGVILVLLSVVVCVVCAICTNTRGEVVLRDPWYLARTLELGDKLLTLASCRGVRMGTVKSLLKEAICHPIIVWREVDRFHSLVKSVAWTKLPLSERRPAGSSKTDYRGNHNDSNQSGLADP